MYAEWIPSLDDGASRKKRPEVGSPRGVTENILVWSSSREGDDPRSDGMRGTFHQQSGRGASKIFFKMKSRCGSRICGEFDIMRLFHDRPRVTRLSSPELFDVIEKDRGRRPPYHDLVCHARSLEDVVYHILHGGASCEIKERANPRINQ